MTSHIISYCSYIDYTKRNIMCNIDIPRPKSVPTVPSSSTVCFPLMRLIWHAGPRSNVPLIVLMGYFG